MKRAFIFALTTLILATSVKASTPPTFAERPYYSTQNILINPGFELGKTGWLASSASTFTINTSAAHLGSGSKSGKFDGTSAGQIISLGDNTRGNSSTSGDGIGGQAWAVSCRFKCDSGTCTHKLAMESGVTEVASATITSNTSGFVRTSVIGTIPAGGSVSPKLYSVAANEPAVYIDDCFVGLADGFNWAQISQAQVLGSLSWASTSSCGWPTTQTSYSANFSNDNDCDDNARTAEGIISDGTSGLRPAFTITNGPAGYYKVTVEGAIGVDDTGNSTSIFSAWRLYDGTTQYGIDRSIGLTASSARNFKSDSVLVFTWNQATALGTKTIDLQAKVTGTNAEAIVAPNTSTLAGLKFTVEVIPSSTQTVARADQTAWKVDANISGANPDLGTVDVTDYASGTIENSSLTMVQNTGSLAVQIPCSSTNPSTGLTCAAGSESVGVVFTLPRAGTVQACASFMHLVTTGSGGGLQAAFEIVETSNTAQTTVQEGNGRVPTRLLTASSSVGFPVMVCGDFTFTSNGQKTLRLRYEQDATATLNGSNIVADADATIGQRDIHWTVYPKTQAESQAFIPGSVFSNSTAVMRVEGATIANSGTPSISTQSGTWMTTPTDNGAGDTTLNIVSGIFSATPWCTCTGVVANGTLSNAQCKISSDTGPSATQVRIVTGNTIGSATDINFNVLCMGPR